MFLLKCRKRFGRNSRRWQQLGVSADAAKRENKDEKSINYNAVEALLRHAASFGCTIARWVAIAMRTKWQE